MTRRPKRHRAETAASERHRTVKAIGALEVLAAVGLILPAALDIASVLVPLAAVGLVLLMVGAFITHLRRHETQPIVVNLALLTLAILVVWGCFGPSPSPANPARRLATPRPEYGSPCDPLWH